MCGEPGGRPVVRASWPRRSGPVFGVVREVAVLVGGAAVVGIVDPGAAAERRRLWVWRWVSCAAGCGCAGECGHRSDRSQRSWRRMPWAAIPSLPPSTARLEARGNQAATRPPRGLSLPPSQLFALMRLWIAPPSPPCWSNSRLSPQATKRRLRGPSAPPSRCRRTRHLSPP